MGCVLSSPVELIHVQRYGSAAFRCAVAEMQGWRNTHEDAHEVRCGGSAGAFWVLDGHGGDGAALYGAPELGKEFPEVLAPGGGALPTDERIEQGLVDVDKKLHQYVRENPDKDAGSTVVGALAALQADGTYVLKLINCGDSRGIVVRGLGEDESAPKAVSLRVPKHLEDLRQDPMALARGDAAKECAWPLVQETIDHKPNHPTEKARIEAAGGTVSEDDPPRLDNNLAVSRGLGDFEYKGKEDRPVAEQKVSCVPDVYEVAGLQPGSFCVLCCDGVWDVLTSQEVGVLVRGMLAEDPETDLGEVAAKIVRESLQRNSRDNVTAMVVQLSPCAEWESPPPDEMKGFEKLVGEDPAPDEDVRKHYMAFLKRSSFPPEPCLCDVCSKWYVNMQQCPCKKVFYCNKTCQKKGWKKHKPACAAANPGSVSSPGSGSAKAQPKSTATKKK